jgi:Leucine-rich repeat (LRR) protein
VILQNGLAFWNVLLTSFSGFQIEYLMDGAFFGLTRIEELSLDRNKVPTISKGWLYGLTTLRFLSLSFNRVSLFKLWMA